MFTHKAKRQIAVATAAAFFSCTSPPAVAPHERQPIPENVQALQRHLQPGDVVFRMGMDVTSYMLASLNDTTVPSFSHCGVASQEGEQWFVYHCIGGELNPDQSMVREPLAWYCSPSDARNTGIYRAQLDAAGKTKLLNVVRSWYAIRLPFDLDFSLQTNHKMYCTEMVAKAIAVAAGTDTMFNPSTRGHFVYLAPSDLIQSPALKLVYVASD